jgi:hypothetical protein
MNLEGGIIVPGKAKVCALGVQWRYQKVSGVDVSLVNAYIPKRGYSGIDLQKYHEEYESVKGMSGSDKESLMPELVYVPMTEVFEVFEFDFNKNLQLEVQKSLSIPTVNSGAITAFVFWFDLELVPGVGISSSPFVSGSKRVCVLFWCKLTLQSQHWLQAIQHLPRGVKVAETGTKVPILASVNKDFIYFEVSFPDGQEIEGLEVLPEIYDPLWRGAKEKVLHFSTLR